MLPEVGCGTAPRACVNAADPFGAAQVRNCEAAYVPASRWKIQSWSGWFLKRHWRFGPAITFR